MVPIPGASRPGWMRTLLFLALAALFGLVWHALLSAVGAFGFGPIGAPSTDELAGWALTPLVTSVATSLVTALLLRRFIVRAGRERRFLPVSLAFWVVGSALWPLLWMAIDTVDHGLRYGWDSALSGGESLFLALVAPYVGFALSAVMVWIIWPLAALEVWLLRRVLPLPQDEAEADSESELEPRTV
jgi:hypothetical protein